MITDNNPSPSSLELPLPGYDMRTRVKPSFVSPVMGNGSAPQADPGSTGTSSMPSDLFGWGGSVTTTDGDEACEAEISAAGGTSVLLVDRSVAPV